ncbi:hypothetical protein EVAR_21068_1 [Eumeta japonica]|uniref:Uncharacterized protein n=1 Tax=Eumeta variegata TaxID=151549 RepID=A0A4C1V1S4_EUMVA|nr:hypothetical protein EVAR_21068_1 [Eumeta japonica]
MNILSTDVTHLRAECGLDITSESSAPLASQRMTYDLKLSGENVRIGNTIPSYATSARTHQMLLLTIRSPSAPFARPALNNTSEPVCSGFLNPSIHFHSLIYSPFDESLMRTVSFVSERP